MTRVPPRPTASVPACRLAAFRVVFALTTLYFHIPQSDGMIASYLTSSFHVPMHEWVPPITPALAQVMIGVRHLAAWCLLLGVLTRLSAACLAVTGAHIFMLDMNNYSHHFEFHLTIFALLAVWNDRLPLGRLMREESDSVQITSWAEWFLRIQVAIVYLSAAIDKIFSSDWGTSGAMISEVYRSGSPSFMLKPHGFPLNVLQDANVTLVLSAPGITSALTILVELLLAAIFMVRSLWPKGMWLALGFPLYLEFAVKQRYFAWDMITAVLLLLPAADHAYIIFHDPACSACVRYRAVVRALDWLRRLRWVPLQGVGHVPGVTQQAPRTAIYALGPDGRIRMGYEALRLVLALIPGPVLAVLTLVRATNGWGAGLLLPEDTVILVIAGLCLLWLPGVARFIGRPLYAHWAAKRACPHSRELMMEAVSPIGPSRPGSMQAEQLITLVSNAIEDHKSTTAI